ncbi:MAG: GTP-binding protein [Candidatus Lokiarchaeota archaeon]|nr:GTP-binding protein [Candidatus Lokiarchaeota archaeon]
MYDYLLPELPADVIDGVGKKTTKKMEKNGIKTVSDLAEVNILELSNQIKVPQHLLIEYRKKARQLREIIFDKEVIDKLESENFTIQELIELSIDKLKDITDLSESSGLKFLDKASTLAIILDAEQCKNLPVSALQTKPYVPKSGDLAKLVDIKEVDRLAIEALNALPPKVSLIGFSGTGKTTIGNLIQNEEFPRTHIPTMTLDIDNIVVGGLNNCLLFDCAGQEQFSFLWDKFIKSSDAIILVVDSTEENVKKSKFFIEKIKKSTPKTPMAVIANKQDLPNILPTERVKEILGGYKTIPLVAIDRNKREKVLNLLADILNLSPKLKNLIPLQIKTDTLIKEAEIVPQYSDKIVKEINALEDEIEEIEKELNDLKKKLSEDISEEKAKEIKRKMIILKSRLRNKERDIGAIKLRSDSCSCLSFDIHQGMRNVNYIIQCKCGYIYKKLYEIDRKTEEVILICPLCGTKFEPSESTWKELRIKKLK